MRITTKLITDIETGDIIARQSYEYCGEVDKVCSSGGDVAKSDLDLQKSQAAMTKTLNDSYKISFGNQQALLGKQAARLDYMAANPSGLDPKLLHIATTSVNDRVASAAKSALGSAAAFAASHGSADIGGGAVGQVAGQIGSEAAQAKSSQLGALDIANSEEKNKNFWSALSGLNQVGSEYGNSAGTAAGNSSGVANSAENLGAGATEAKYAGMQAFGSVLSGISGLAQAGVKAYTGGK
jgi:hypothetical protein